MMKSSDQRLVCLPNGRAVSLSSYLVAWQLETKGLTLRGVGDRLHVGPSARLTDADRHLIRQHKLVLLTLARSEPALA